MLYQGQLSLIILEFQRVLCLPKQLTPFIPILDILGEGLVKFSGL